MTEPADQEARNLSCPKCMATYRGGFETCPVDGATLSEADVDPLLGVTIADQYVVDKCVGEGAMGRVYLAHHVRLTKRKFAMKVLLGDLAADPTMRLRFAQEAEAASRLQHPNVVPVLDFGTTDGGLHYLVMDFIEGGTLADLIEAGAISEKETISIAIQICNGLTHAHDQGLVHRDFKPDNVALVKRDGKTIPKILDFGLAIISTPEEASVRLTSAGLVVGTPAYVSPEQCQGKPVDLGTDLFAFGVSLYEMASGMLPFDGSVIELLYKNATEQAPPILQRSGIQVSEGLEAVIMRLMAKARAERFADAREVLAALEAISSPSEAVIRGAALSDARATPPPSQLGESVVAATQLDGEALVVAGTADSQIHQSQADVGAAEEKRSKLPMIGLGVLLLGALAVAGVVIAGGGEDSKGNEVAAIVPPPADAGPAETPTVVEPALDAAADSLPAAIDASTVVIPAEKDPEPTTPKRPRKPRKPRKPDAKPDTKVPDPEPVPEVKPPEPKPVPEVKPVPGEMPAPRRPPEVKPPPTPPPPPPKVPTSFKAAMEVSDFSSTGSLAPSKTFRNRKKIEAALAKCYGAAARQAGRNAGVSVKVRFQIDESGRAASIKVGGVKVLPKLSGCIKAVLKKVKSKSPPDTGTQKVKFTVNYKPKQ